MLSIVKRGIIIAVSAFIAGLLVAGAIVTIVVMVNAHNDAKKRAWAACVDAHTTVSSSDGLDKYTDGLIAAANACQALTDDQLISRYGTK